MKERTFNILLILSAPLIAASFVLGGLVLLEHYVLRDCPPVLKIHDKDKP